eukprot:CAMPEP_0116871940 /NCGR_PEP_ID=MMETSP0463-20121206/2509_1 /TAXON_ID=181622 /ORGANISM="Strombidinopsis sp, Strain SopsisLIS2011" /LENGTH=151 /DNA_ID=CAMNT_0004511301 /DNA_START=1123 /DNA_END=1578 /DNA_ORIENTATION=-
MDESLTSEKLFQAAISGVKPISHIKTSQVLSPNDRSKLSLIEDSKFGEVITRCNKKGCQGAKNHPNSDHDDMLEQYVVPDDSEDESDDNWLMDDENDDAMSDGHRGQDRRDRDDNDHYDYDNSSIGTSDIIKLNERDSMVNLGETLLHQRR